MHFTTNTPSHQVETDWRSSTPRPQGARGLLARDAILDAALRVIGQQGLPAASLGAIAREARTSKPAVLYHFGSKEKLLREVASRAMERFHRDAYQAAREAGDGQARVAMETLFSKSNRPFAAAVRELMAIGSRDPHVAETVRSAFDQIDRMVALLLPCPPEQALPTAREIVRSVYGYLSLWICSGDEDPGYYREEAMRVASKLWETREPGASVRPH